MKREEEVESDETKQRRYKSQKPETSTTKKKEAKDQRLRKIKRQRKFHAPVGLPAMPLFNDEVLDANAENKLRKEKDATD